MHLFNGSFNDTAATSCRKSCPDSSMVFNTIQAAIESTGVARDDITDSSRTSGRPRTMMIDGCCRSFGNDRAPIAETWRLIPMAPKTNLLISDTIRSPIDIRYDSIANRYPIRFDRQSISDTIRSPIDIRYDTIRYDTIRSDPIRSDRPLTQSFKILAPLTRLCWARS